MISIGDLEVDLQRRQILRNGVPLRLGSRAFDILELLIDADGALVTKDEIMRLVWPRTVVEENNLQVHVTALRKALGANRQLIMTVPGRGYRLMRSAPAQPDTVAANSATVGTLSSIGLEGGAGELFGRDVQLTELLGALQRAESLTVVGPGGIGKTRLALEAARRACAAFADGVAFVPFASVSDERFALDAVAAALPLKLPCAPLSLDMITDAVLGKRLLVILDNCEHIIDAAAGIALSLRKAGCVVLTTSREPLRIPGEVLYAVPPLEVPECDDGRDKALLSGAVRLFLARACAVQSAFPTDDRSIALIGVACRALDGIPLAIELAAARAAMLGAETLCNHLQDRLRILTGGCRTALPRHQTMRATLDWSYRLLNDQERTLLRSLGVFLGGFTFEAVSFIGEDAGLSAQETLDAFGGLVAKSMVAQRSSGLERRYRLLEITREYALQQLDDNGTRKAALSTHARYLLTRFERARNDPGEQTDDSILAHFSSELDNIRAMLDWSLSSSGDQVLGMTLASVTVPLFFELALVRECCARAEQALRAYERAVGCNVRAEVLLSLGAAFAAGLVYTEGPTARTREAWETVLAEATRVGNVEFEARALWGLWNACQYGGEPERALAMAWRFCEVARRTADTTQSLLGMRIEGIALHYAGDHAQARARLEAMLRKYDHSVHRWRVLGFRIEQGIVARATLARVLWIQGDTQLALRVARAAYDDALAYGNDMMTCYVLVEAQIPLAILEENGTCAREALVMLNEMAGRNSFHIWVASADCYHQCVEAMVAPRQSSMADFARAIAHLRQTGFLAPLTFVLCRFAQALLDAGEHGQAGVVIDQALAHCEATGEKWFFAEICRLKGLVCNVSGAADKATEWWAIALTTARRQGARSLELRASQMGVLRLDHHSYPVHAPALTGLLTAKFGRGVRLAST